MIKKVCILMATYNGAEYIEEQIQTILNQLYVDVTLYVSDDFSTDNTLNIIRRYQSYCNLHVLNNENKFGSAGKNFFSMIERVDFDEFDFISFADQDDVWNSDKTYKSISYLEENKECAGVSSCVEAFWTNGRIFYVNKSTPQRDFDYFFEAAGPGCTYLFRSTLAIKLKSLLRSNLGSSTPFFLMIGSFMPMQGK